MSDEPPRSSSSPATATAAILAPEPARVCAVPTAPRLCHAVPAPRRRPLALFKSTRGSAADDARLGELQLDPYTAPRRARSFAAAGPLRLILDVAHDGGGTSTRPAPARRARPDDARGRRLLLAMPPAGRGKLDAVSSPAATDSDDVPRMGRPSRRRLARAACPPSSDLVENAGAQLQSWTLLCRRQRKLPATTDERHSGAVEIMKHKVDLIKPEAALEQIAKFLKVNIDAVNECIPITVRNFVSSRRLIVIRWFDGNSPGALIDELRGGVAGGSILRGVLHLGMDVELRLTQDHYQVSERDLQQAQQAVEYGMRTRMGARGNSCRARLAA
ncbi:hypothetical protein AURDEDRAFT_168957 [Auricularia subglabra TFB-10046 SS5]|nr:hypothetical protein AURDEDRAFT_168957 [Auricularia subglabra TFB-10046 SS5]